MFSPSLAGAYREVITIENLLDKRDVQLVTVKAQIHKRSNFHLLGVSSVDFGLCAVNEPSEREILIKITNDSDKSRKFSAEIGPKLLADVSRLVMRREKDMIAPFVLPTSEEGSANTVFPLFFWGGGVPARLRRRET